MAVFVTTFSSYSSVKNKIKKKKKWNPLKVLLSQVDAAGETRKRLQAHFVRARKGT